MCLKIGYFADGQWAHLAFEKLITDRTISISFICVRYDKRDEQLIKYAQTYDIPVLIHQNVNSEQFINEIRKYDADLFVSMSFNQIFKEEIRNIPRLKSINCHAGKLPFYRGRNILNWVLINDENEFGITVHYIDDGIDTGDIILQRTYPISDNDNYSTLLQKAYIGCAEILYDAIKLIQNDQAVRIEQDKIDNIGTYFGMRKENDEIIDWNQSSREIFNFVRAISKPGPQATSYIGDKKIFINKANLIDKAHEYRCIVGQVIGKTESGFLVKTKDTFVEIVEYSYDGKIKIGDRLNRGEDR